MGIRCISRFVAGAAFLGLSWGPTPTTCPGRSAAQSDLKDSLLAFLGLSWGPTPQTWPGSSAAGSDVKDSRLAFLGLSRGPTPTTCPRGCAARHDLEDSLLSERLCYLLSPIFLHSYVAVTTVLMPPRTEKSPT